MKLLTREFTRNEKILLVVLAVIILALCYYQFVYLPVRNQITSANSEADELETEMLIAEAKLKELQTMEQELSSLEADGGISAMPSYNNAKAEIAFLNDVLADTEDYSINISGVTRDGDQIRRNVTLKFTVTDYEQAEQAIREMEDCEYRCLISELRINIADNKRDVVENLTDDGNTITVTATATFYETLVGGTADAGLPEDQQKEAAAAEE